MKDRKIIARFRIGSHLYGLNNENSDEDFVSIFIPNPEDILGLQTIEEFDNSTKSSDKKRRNNNTDIDDKYYSLHKFLRLLIQNNPNIVELLFINKENILILEPEFQELIDNYDKIISQKILYTFSGYAFAQKKKLTIKAERFKSLKKGLDFLEIHKKKSILSEELAEELNSQLIYYKGQKNNCESFHKGMSIDIVYNKLKYEYENYGWRVNTDTFEKLGYDIKFAYHLIRLYSEGLEILRTGKLQFPIKNKSYKDILKIRNGEVVYNELLDMCRLYENDFNSFNLNNSPLRKYPDFNWVNNWLIETLKKYIINER